MAKRAAPNTAAATRTRRGVTRASEEVVLSGVRQAGGVGFRDGSRGSVRVPDLVLRTSSARNAGIDRSGSSRRIALEVQLEVRIRARRVAPQQSNRPVLVAQSPRAPRPETRRRAASDGAYRSARSPDGSTSWLWPCRPDASRRRPTRPEPNPSSGPLLTRSSRPEVLRRAGRVADDQLRQA